MKRTLASTGIAIAVAIAISVAGCSSSPSSNNAASKTSATGSATTSTTTAKPQSKVAPRITAQGPNPSIASYFQHSHITATPVHKGDPGARPSTSRFRTAGPTPDPTPRHRLLGHRRHRSGSGQIHPQHRGDAVQARRRCRPAEADRTRRRRNEKSARFQADGRGLEDNLGGFPPISWAAPGRRTARRRPSRTKSSSSTGTTTSICWSSTRTASQTRSRRRFPATITIDEKTTINVG